MSICGDQENFLSILCRINFSATGKENSSRRNFCHLSFASSTLFLNDKLYIHVRTWIITPAFNKVEFTHEKFPIAKDDWYIPTFRGLRTENVQPQNREN